MKRLPRSPQVTNNGRLVQLNKWVIPSIVNEKLREVCDKIGVNRASALDGISSKVLKLKWRLGPVFGWGYDHQLCDFETMESRTLWKWKLASICSSQIDVKLNFTGHLEHACQKAPSAIAVVSKMLPNIDEPQRRRNVSSRSGTIHSALRVTCVGRGVCKFSGTEAGKVA